MKKKILLLLLAGVLIFVANFLCIVGYAISKTGKLVEVNETDFLAKLHSHQATVKGIAHATGPGLDSYSVLWSYKNPSGNEIECATDWVKGSQDELEALIKQDSVKAPAFKPTTRIMLFRWMPLIFFVAAAGVIFRQEISLIFKRTGFVPR